MINYNDPTSIYYKTHDICSDIKDGIISDSEATDKLLLLMNEQLYQTVAGIISTLPENKRPSVGGFINFIEDAIKSSFEEVAV